MIITKEANKGNDKNTDGGIVYRQILTDEKLKTGKKCQKTEQTGRSPLRRRRSTLDCSAIYEDELEEEICLIA